MTEQTMLLEFLHPDGEPVLLADLGLDFIDRNGLPMANAQRPFRVEIEGRQSKAGNAYFSYEHGQVPLPDGFDTIVRVGGVEPTMETERLSQSGNPTRKGRATIEHNGLRYDVVVYLTRGSKPYWVKVHVQKASKKSAAKKMVGGRIV